MQITIKEICFDPETGEESAEHTGAGRFVVEIEHGDYRLASQSVHYNETPTGMVRRTALSQARAYMNGLQDGINAARNSISVSVDSNVLLDLAK